jgi:hypothetical protein
MKENSWTIMGKRLKLTDEALLASFKTDELLVKKKNSHNIGKELILPACKEIVEVILCSEAAEEISKVPL